MIAMAMANDPAVLIADEPTTALDVTIQAQIVEVLKAAQQETQAAIVLITHDLGLIAELADRVVVMYAGRVVEQGDVFEIFNSPRHPYTIGLMKSLASSMPTWSGSSRSRDSRRASSTARRVALSTPAARCHRAGDLPDGHAGAQKRRGRARDPPLRLPLRRRARRGTRRRGSLAWARLRERDAGSRRRATPAATNGGELLRIEGLVKHFPIKAGVFKHTVGQVKAVDGVDLTVEPGETLGIVGRVGLRQDDAGAHDHQAAGAHGRQDRLRRPDITKLKRRQMRPVRRDIQIVFQDPYASLNPRMTVREIVGEPLRIHGLYRGARG